ncbi:unnamed protein product, partial [Ectocarpus fasciculatus]
AVTSPGLDSSRLSAAFGAALGAVDDGGAVSEGDIDVGSDAAAALPAYGEVEGGAATGIPGVNPGTAGVAADADAPGSALTFEKQVVAALDAIGVPV